MEAEQVRRIRSRLGLLATLAVGALFAATPASATDIFLNNLLGSDAFDGSAPKPGKPPAGPVATLARACELLEKSDRLIMANTGKPYRGTLALSKGGTPGKPMVIEGNGATIEGLDATKPEEWTVGENGLVSTAWDAPWGFSVVVNRRMSTIAQSLEGLAPGASVWVENEKRGYYRLRDGQSLSDLEVPRYCNGVQITECGYISVRNLCCQFYYNDGFNISGVCPGLRFEHVESRWNGDEGISAHSIATLSVLDAHLHHNQNGVADCQLSQTFYDGLRVHDNWSVGVYFLGGYHTVNDAQILDNGIAIMLEPLADVYEAGGDRDPLRNCTARLSNVYVRGGRYGLQMSGGSRASVEHATFVNNDVAISLSGEDTDLHIVNSIIAGAREWELSIPSGLYYGDYNCWSGDRVFADGRAQSLREWGAANGLEQHSIFAEPRLVRGIGPRLSADSPCLDQAYVSPDLAQWLRGQGKLDERGRPVVGSHLGAHFGDAR
jgi:hypothetical protein